MDFGGQLSASLKQSIVSALLPLFQNCRTQHAESQETSLPILTAEEQVSNKQRLNLLAFECGLSVL